MKRSRLLTAVAWLTPTWLVLSWLFAGLFSGEVLFKRDTLLFGLPQKRFLSDALSRGAFPEWWPWDGLGQPFVSLPLPSAFHPTTVLFVLLPFGLALAVQQLLPLVLMPVGTWALARTAGLRPGGAGFAAAVVGVSFWNVLLAEFTCLHLAAAALPWFWREALRLRKSRRGSPVVLALATANLALGGDPMLLALACLGLVPLSWRWPLRWRGLGRVAAPIALGLLVGAPQLVPMAWAFVDSPRALGQAIATDDYWALRLPQLATTLLPVHFGTDYFYDCVYVGVPTVAFALAGVAGWRLGRRLLVLLVLLVVTAFGREGGLWLAWSALIPGWSGFQYPVKALGPAVLVLALLAGRGLFSPRRRLAAAASGVGGVALLLAGGGAGPLPLVVALLAWLRERRPRFAPGLLRAMSALVAADVAWQLGPFPTWPARQLDEPPALARVLEAAGVGAEAGFYDWTYTVPEAMDTRLPGWRDVQTEFQALTVAPVTGALHGLPTARYYLGGVTRRAFTVRQSGEWPRLAPLFGVVARLESFQGSHPPQPNLAADLELGAAVVPVPGARPRAYVAFEVTPVEPAAQLAALASAAGAVVVVDPGNSPLATRPTRPLQPVPLRRGDDTLELDVTLDAPGLLVVNEAWARGWSAHVNGRPAPVIPANHAVLGVVLPAGAHRVRFEYSTPGLALGIGICVVGLVGLLAGAAWRRRRGRLRSR